VDSFLSERIANLDRKCGLTDAQKAKLQLAAQGDIKRHFERVEEATKRLDGRKYDLTKAEDRARSC
jgi:hypothetical protein